jgi:ribosomal protein S18 acetylase RimI-like enzyme
MAVDYRIRKMATDDISHVVKIQETILQKKVSKAWKKALELYIEKDPQTCLVAVKDEKPIGFIIGEVKIWGFGLRQSGWIEILGIQPEHMGTGVGKALGKKLLNYFKKQKVDGIYTAVRWDSGDLLSFFKSIGFDHSGFLNLEYKKLK